MILSEAPQLEEYVKALRLQAGVVHLGGHITRRESQIGSRGMPAGGEKIKESAIKRKPSPKVSLQRRP